MDREADVTVSESDRLHSQLSRFEDMFPGYRMEIVEGAIVMSPLKPHHNATIWQLWSVLKSQLSDQWGFLSDVAIPFDGENEFCPDLAVVPAVEADKNLSAYSPDLVELAVEVVSRGSIRNDYEIKDRAYARRGIPHYLIFDPYKAQCVTLWNPGPDGYLGRDVVPYGNTVVVETGIGKLTVDTSDLPVDPGATAP
ncbi:Uma2 family endonuclease [Streptomyces sp. NBC_00320]|uniref:Uma2 family endonuclease n=1 Tax=unclassified Streptomyces TaxID=2593676 RepID=UPI00225330D7|nr:Uma2 family endonuclease [Streptomyces sp. NBC_00320]MCX5146167.1 Uma2 family endonuclease [Streptomyces sp. NBC_00320]WSW61208.1 Uma2 family endonuclease [Streptomyces sp. NBC_00998]